MCTCGNLLPCQPWKSRGGHYHNIRDSLNLHSWCALLQPQVSCSWLLTSFPLSFLSGHSKASKHLLSETGSPSTSQGASAVWPQLWPLLQLKKKQCAIWKLDMVRKRNLTCKQLRMWVMCDTQPHICTQFAQRIPVIFWGWNKTLVHQAPQLWRAEIWGKVFQPGFPSDRNISCCNSRVPLFRMLSVFSAPATHGWKWA